MSDKLTIHELPFHGISDNHRPHAEIHSRAICELTTTASRTLIKLVSSAV